MQNEARLTDDPEVREAIDAGSRDDVPEVVADYPASPLAWTELADIADSEGRPVDAYAYATVAADLGREQLASAGWQPGEPVPWSDEANRAYLRALDTQRRAAEQLGLADRADAAAAELDAADEEAHARIVSEFTPTQMIPIIPAADLYQAPADVEAALAETVAFESAGYADAPFAPAAYAPVAEAPAPGIEPLGAGPVVIADADADGADVIETDGADPAAEDASIDGADDADDAADAPDAAAHPGVALTAAVGGAPDPASISTVAMQIVAAPLSTPHEPEPEPSAFGPAVTRATFTAAGVEETADYLASHGVPAEDSPADSAEPTHDEDPESPEER